MYFVDDGYAKSDDEVSAASASSLDPRGVPAGDTSRRNLGFRIPGGTTAGMSEIIRPQNGMIVMYPGWMTRGERRFEGAGQRVTIEFELALP